MQDLTTITTPFGLLDEATQKALKEHGGPYELLSCLGAWERTFNPVFRPNITYRVRHEPTQLGKTFFGIAADKFSDNDLTEIGECVAQELADRALSGRLTNE